MVADVGARSGIQKHWLSLPYPVRILGFEPDAEECRALSERALSESADGRSSICYYPFALAEKSEKRTLYLYKDRRLSSFFLPDSDLMKAFPVDKLLCSDAFAVEKEVTVDCVSLDELCDKEDIRDLDVIKLDTQGSELEILRGSSNILSSMFAVEVEVEFTPIYKDQPLFGDVDTYLRQKGFTLFDLRRHWWMRDTTPHVRSRGQIVFGDALYMRDLLSSNEKTKTYQDYITQAPSKTAKTVMVAVALGYPDYALNLIDHFIDQKLISAELASVLRSACITPAVVPKSGLSGLWQRISTAVYASRAFRNIEREGRRNTLAKRLYDNDDCVDYRD